MELNQPANPTELMTVSVETFIAQGCDHYSVYNKEASFYWLINHSFNCKLKLAFTSSITIKLVIIQLTMDRYGAVSGAQSRK